jgi:hypothetical protein
MLKVPEEVAMPLRLTVCGLPAELLVSVSVAVRVPGWVGVKVMSTPVLLPGEIEMGRAAL